MNRRTLLAALLTTVVGPAQPILAQSGKLQRFRARLKTRSRSVVGTTVEVRDQYEAVVKLQKRYPGSTILNLKPDGSEPSRQRRLPR